METVALPVSVNQTEKINKKEKSMNRPAETIHGLVEPIHGLPSLQPLTRT
jgi:hypothetical protein